MVHHAKELIMKIPPDAEFVEICGEIQAENLTVAEWREIESDDMFQSEHFCGGFEAIEDAFCFSYYSPDGPEYWFQITLEEAQRIAAGELITLDLRLPRQTL